ncbi:MAG: LytTR family DNA-binding domain-containing protein [Prolixibacteraceae bacterium]|jgi:two-component system LytT family response regulator|nr:LytTR family DNA-binding domain-containing protein [Prolixibacteraceae bacterium]
MERVIKALIVDDDSTARNILTKFLDVGEAVNIVASVNNAASALVAVEQFQPDVIFLDINMPQEDGLKFAKRIRKKNIDVQIVFTTAYRNYAASAFDLKPIDFLVKPFGINDVFDVLTKIEDFFNQREIDKGKQQIWGAVIPEKLKFKTVNGYSFINPKDILYVKVFGALTELVFVNGEKERINSILTDLNEDLKNFNFLRINRSVIINLNYIERIEKKNKTCILKSNDIEYDFPITRSIFKYFENMKSVKLG